MEVITLTNRTDHTIEALWDGKRYQIPVGQSAYPRAVAEAAKRQNIVMGSEDPTTGDVISLVGIEEWGDDCTPIDARPLSVERWNRNKMPNPPPTEIVKGKTGVYSVRDVSGGPLPLDSNFVKP